MRGGGRGRDGGAVMLDHLLASTFINLKCFNCFMPRHLEKLVSTKDKILD